jgi:hypothetical protein
MASVLLRAGLLLAALVHLLPLAGVLGAGRLRDLYGIPVEGPDLAILLRHRAVLFGLLGAFLALAAFRPALQGLALAAGFASVLAFLALAWATPGYNAALARVVWADWVALAGLVVAAAAWWTLRRTLPKGM